MNEIICRSDLDCEEGFFCAKHECDSLEGWTFSCSQCVSCETCLCDEDALSGLCPQSRCPGTPLNGLQEISGTFYSAVSVGEWGGDVCVAMTKFYGLSFEQSSFRVSRSTYDFNPALFPVRAQVEHVWSTLCAWPDSLPHKVGLAEPEGAPFGYAGKIRLTYYSGFPLGTTRSVYVKHKCPIGLTFEFEPVYYLAVPFDPRLAKDPDGIRRTAPYAFSVQGDLGEGYYFEGNLARRMSMDFLGPSFGDDTMKDLAGHFSGEYVFGTTRLNPESPGYFPGLICNIDFVMTPSRASLMQFSKHTFNCRKYDPETIQGPKPETTPPAPTTAAAYLNFTTTSPPPLLLRRAGEINKDADSGTWVLREEEVCSAGSFLNARNDSQCNRCPIGTYKDSAGNQRCEFCIPGFLTVRQGTRNSDDCCAAVASKLHSKRAVIQVKETSIAVHGSDCVDGDIWQCKPHIFRSVAPKKICSHVLLSIQPWGALWFRFTVRTDGAIVPAAVNVAWFEVEGGAILPAFTNRTEISQYDVLSKSVDRSTDHLVSFVVGQEITTSLAGYLVDRYESFTQAIERKEANAACEFSDLECAEARQSRQEFFNGLVANEFITMVASDPREIRLKPMGLHVQVDSSALNSPNDLAVVQYASRNASDLCPRGTFSPDGFPPTEAPKKCEPCPKGSFAPGFGHTACLECPTGSFSLGSGQANCSLCPLGTSTLTRGVSNASHCLPFCSPGYFSSTGLLPCEPCSRGFTSDTIGATSCQKCPRGFSTPGVTGEAFTGVAPLTCFDVSDIDFGFEQVKLTGQKFFMTVKWKIPASEASVGDILAIMYGDGFQSYRQLEWSYTSAGGAETDAACVDLLDSGCKVQGSNPIPWGSRTFTIYSAGPGTYSVVLFSDKRKDRILSDSWECVHYEITDLNTGELAPCPSDRDDWIVHTGLAVCDAGTISADRVPPCEPCPPGSFNRRFAQTTCFQCPLVTIAPNPGATECTPCPPGYSTQGKGERSCSSCLSLQPDPEVYYPGCNISDVDLVVTTMPGQTPVGGLKPCGNGFINRGEQCDDGNRVGGDGCSFECVIEEFFKCSRPNPTTPDTCVFTCGNMVVEPESGEKCDDGNRNGGDGCSPLCQIDPGFGCRAELTGRSYCWILPICGNGLREWRVPNGEQCDDGNTEDGDGCDSKCRTELHHTCVNSTTAPDVCCADLVLCGNGILEICEKCDDGNLIMYDGCSATCTKEALSRCESSCAGPACSVLSLPNSDETCPEHVVGEAQADPSLDIWRRWNVDGLLGPDGSVDDDGSGSLGVSSSESLWVQYLGGPSTAGFAHFYQHVEQRSNSFESDVFRSLFNFGQHETTLQCPHCKTYQEFHWPNGSISEGHGPLPNNRRCTFILTAGGSFVSTPTRGMIVYIDYLDLRLNETISVRATVGGDAVVFTSTSRYPVMLHLIAPVEIVVSLTSFLNDATGWVEESDHTALRYAIRYEGLFLGSRTFQCTSACGLGDSLCFVDNKCFTLDSKFIWVSDMGLSVERRSMSTHQGGSERQLRQDLSALATSIEGFVDHPGRFSGRKLNSVLFNELFISMAGHAGEMRDLPCAISQTQDTVLLDFTSRQDVLGADGVWEGVCASQQNCLEQITLNNKDACTPDEQYLNSEWTCKVKWYVQGLHVREFRYGCGGLGPGPGVSEAVIVDTFNQVQDIIRNPDTDSPLYIYQRFRIAWTRSNSGRPLGVSRAIYSFGNSPSYKNGGNLQVLMAEPGVSAHPSPRLLRSFEEMLNAPGGCNRMSMKKVTESSALMPADLVLGDISLLDDYYLYKSCNDSFVSLRETALSSPDCTSMWDVYMARDALSPWSEPPSVLDATCMNSCFRSFQAALETAVDACRSSWIAPHNRQFYTILVFKKLFIASTALFWMEVSCFRNHLGLYCTRPAQNFSNVFDEGGCEPFDPRLTTVLSAPFTFENKTRQCSQNCINAFIDYQRADHCCASTFAEAQQQWASRLSHPTRTRPVQVDFGVTIDPWTQLGTGSRQQFNVRRASACSRTWLDATCMMTESCGSRNWRPKCCKISCRNQGTKKHDGSCYCACPVTNTGNECINRNAHVRATLVFTGESLFTFQYIHELWALEGVAAGLSVPLDRIERDSIDEEIVERRSNSTSAILFGIRIITPTDREAQRLGVLLNEAVQQGNMERSIEGQSGIPLTWDITLALQDIPRSYDASGGAMCDNVLVMCPTQDEDLKDVYDGGIGENGGGISAETIAAICGAIGGVLLCFCGVLIILVRYGVIDLFDKKKKRKKQGHEFKVPTWIKNRDLSILTAYFRRNEPRAEERPIVFTGDPFQTVKPFSKRDPGSAQPGAQKNYDRIFEKTAMQSAQHDIATFVTGKNLVTGLQDCDRDKAVEFARHKVVLESQLGQNNVGADGAPHFRPMPILGESEAVMARLFGQGEGESKKKRYDLSEEEMIAERARVAQQGMLASQQKKGKIDKTIEALTKLDRGLKSTKIPETVLIGEREAARDDSAQSPFIRSMNEPPRNMNGGTPIRQAPSITSIAASKAPSSHLAEQLEAEYPYGPPSQRFLGPQSPR